MDLPEGHWVRRRGWWHDEKYLNSAHSIPPISNALDSFCTKMKRNNLSFLRDRIAEIKALEISAEDEFDLIARYWPGKANVKDHQDPQDRCWQKTKHYLGNMKDYVLDIEQLLHINVPWMVGSVPSAPRIHIDQQLNLLERKVNQEKFMLLRNDGVDYGLDRSVCIRLPDDFKALMYLTPGIYSPDFAHTGLPAIGLKMPSLTESEDPNCLMEEDDFENYKLHESLNDFEIAARFGTEPGGPLVRRRGSRYVIDFLYARSSLKHPNRPIKFDESEGWRWIISVQWSHKWSDVPVNPLGRFCIDHEEEFEAVHFLTMAGFLHWYATWCEGLKLNVVYETNGLREGAVGVTPAPRPDASIFWKLPITRNDRVFGQGTRDWSEVLHARVLLRRRLPAEIVRQIMDQAEYYVKYRAVLWQDMWTNKEEEDVSNSTTILMFGPISRQQSGYVHKVEARLFAFKDPDAYDWESDFPNLGPAWYELTIVDSAAKMAKVAIQALEGSSNSEMAVQDDQDVMYLNEESGDSWHPCIYTCTWSCTSGVDDRRKLYSLKEGDMIALTAYTGSAEILNYCRDAVIDVYCAPF